MNLSPILDALSSLYAGAREVARKTKLRTEMKLIDREIVSLQKAFGVTMFDHVNPLSQLSDFHASTDSMTKILRPPLFTAQHKIQELADKHISLNEALTIAVTKRGEAFSVKAETMGMKISNLGKASVMRSGETKIKAQLVIVNRKMESHKQTFGLNLFEALSEAEDNEELLTADSDSIMRSIYDQTRGEAQILKTKKNQKEEDLSSLGESKVIQAYQPPVQEHSLAPSALHGTSC